MVFGQGRQHQLQVAQVCGNWLWGRCIFEGAELDGCSLILLRFLSRAGGKISDRRIEKSLEVSREPKSREFLEEIEKSFLEDIQRGLFVPGKPVHQADDPIAITKVQHLERVRIAAINRCDQLQITKPVEVVLSLHPRVHEKTLRHGSRL